VAAIIVSSISAPGVISTPAAFGIAATVTVGDTITSPDDRTIVVVFNGSGGSINVTISDPGNTPAGNVGTLVPRAVAAGALGFFPVGPANADANGIATVICSAVTSVRVGAIRR
jgi:hypothetical protein